MLTTKTIKGGADYVKNHLSCNDYYSEKERVVGQWMGRGAGLLDLSGEVRMDQIEAIRAGCNPHTGEFLRQRHSEIAFYDCVISAPKAVSVQSRFDGRLVEAHRIAAERTILEAERMAATRVRLGGANEDRLTGNLVIARYGHDTSRALDPDLHTHFLTANMTYDGAERRWKALAARFGYDEQRYLNAYYRNTLAAEAAKCGYEISNLFENGKDLGFSFPGLQESTLEKFSQRSTQRDEAIARFIEKNGRKPDNDEIAQIVQLERTSVEISTGRFHLENTHRGAIRQKVRRSRVKTSRLGSYLSGVRTIL
jgi:conjugative relaxase-like TrwC/TraI family protein